MSNITQLCRSNETVLRDAIAVVTQARVAEMAGVNASTVSRWVTADLSLAAAYLAAANLRLVPADQPDVTPAEYQALAQLASVRVRKILAGE